MVLGTCLLLGSYLLLFFLNFGCSYDDLPCITLVNQERELDRCSVDVKHFILFHPFARNDSSGLLFVCPCMHIFLVLLCSKYMFLIPVAHT